MLKRRKPIARGGRPIRKTRPKRKQRSAAETERVYGSTAFRDWLHRQPCLCCGSLVGIEQAHFGKHAMGKKNDWTRTGPLDRLCHSALDRRSSMEFWLTGAQRALLDRRLALFHAEWQNHLAGTARDTD